MRKLLFGGLAALLLGSAALVACKRKRAAGGTALLGIARIRTLIGGIIRTIIIPTPIGIIPTIATLGTIKETVRGGGVGAAACVRPLLTLSAQLWRVSLAAEVPAILPNTEPETRPVPPG